MNNYDYIKIAVTTATGGTVSTVYSYPSADSSAWDSLSINPETVIKNFLNARDCYLMWNDGGVHYFSLIARNPLDANMGYAMLTLRLDRGYMLTGRQTINTLTALRKTLIEDGDRFDEAVKRCLETTGIPQAGVKLEAWEKPASLPSQKPSGFCYRTYVSGQDLETILSFPNQQEYGRFEHVIVIAATASLRPGIHIERITSPVRRSFTIICPEGVTASKTVATEGERITLTYTKPGFSSRKETIIAGAPSPYVRYEGPAIRVKSAAESGMGFVRRVKLVVNSAKGGMVTGYTINVNGRPVNTMEPYIELNEMELTPGSTTEISVASNNFRPLKVTKDSRVLAEMDTLELTLTPMEQGIILRLDFGEGRTFEQEISIEKNTPEYSQLHSGNFHGFRAHRVTTSGGGEIYNVDVRAGSKPTAPAFVNVTEKAAAPSGPIKAPVFENISNSHSQEKPRDKKRNELPEKEENEPRRHDDEKDERSLFERMGLTSPKIGYILSSVLAIAVIVLGLVYFLPSSDSASDSTENTEATAFTADPEALAETQAAENANKPAEAQPAAPAATSAADETADITYLNENKVWELQSIKSPKYQALVNAIAEGDINAIANNEYFTSPGRATNKYALDIVKWAWEAKGTFQEGKNVDVLKNAVKDGRVNMYDLWEKISRYKPAQPNSQPLPSKTQQ